MSLKKTAIAAFLVAGLGFVTVSAPAMAQHKGKGEEQKKERKEDKHEHHRKLIQRTQGVLLHAHEAVKKGGAEKEDFREAWIYQHAAWKALKNDHPNVAARLSLEARRMARKVIEANHEKVKEEHAKDEPEEQKLAEGASDADVKAAADETRKDAPSADELLKRELKHEKGHGEHEKGQPGKGEHEEGEGKK